MTVSWPARRNAARRAAPAPNGSAVHTTSASAGSASGVTWRGATTIRGVPGEAVRSAAARPSRSPLDPASTVTSTQAPGMSGSSARDGTESGAP